MQNPSQPKKPEKKERAEAILNYCEKLSNIKLQDRSQIFYTSTTSHTSEQLTHEEKKERRAPKSNHFMHYEKHSMLLLLSAVNREFSLFTSVIEINIMPEITKMSCDRTLVWWQIKRKLETATIMYSQCYLLYLQMSVSQTSCPKLPV